MLSGVKQGCVMSDFLFLIVIDWVMKGTVENKKKIGNLMETDNNL